MKLEQLFSLRSALIVSALILTITFLYPLSGDNALYMYMADLLLKGHLPYVGSWDHNYPGIVFIHAFHVALFGASITGFHLFDVICQLVLAGLLYRTVILLGSPREAGWLAAVGATIYYVGGGLALYGERDCYLAVLIVAAIYVQVKTTRNANLTSALFLGLGLLMRPTALAYIGVFGLWLYITVREGKVTTALKYTLISVVPLSVLFAIYAAIGELHAYFEATYTYNVELYARPGVGIDDLRVLSTHWFLLIGSILGLFLLWREHRKYAMLLGLFVAASLVSLVPVYRFMYHFHPLMMLLFICGSIGWVGVMLRYARGLRYAALCFVPVALAVVIRSYFVVGQPMLGLQAWTKGNIDSSYAKYSTHPSWGIAVQDSLAEYLRSRGAKHLQSTTSTMYPLLASGVEPVNRFTNIFNLSFRSQKTNALTPMQERWREEYITALRTTPPEYIISSRSLPDHVFNNGYLPDDVVGAFPDLERLIEMEYDSVRQFGGYTVYEQKR